MKILLTGATGMVGEGVLLAALDDPRVEHVLSLSRRASGITHAKLEEWIVPDFLAIDDVSRVAGYDACFYCAGISSAGMKEAAYTKITYDTPLHLARLLAATVPGMTMNHVSGGHTDSTEKGRVMWARVKGRAENALMKLPFKATFNYRPGLMIPVPGQTRVKALFRVFTVVLRPFFPAITLKQLCDAMINATAGGFEKSILEVPDIRALAAREP